MMRGQEETSTSQVGRRRRSGQELLITSSLVDSMSMEELRSFYRVLKGISLELLDGPAFSTVGKADNTIDFTWEQFVVGLSFLVLSLVKQFLYVTRSPPALIHPNFFYILMDCIMLNFLY